MGDLEQSPKDADLLKLEILLGISFRVSRSNLLRSLQGNTGIWAVLQIKNDLSQGMKVHNFASFPTTADSSCLGCALPFTKGSQVCTLFPSLPSSGRQEAPTTLYV